MDADRQVIRQVLDGDVDAFEVLLRKYAARVFGCVAKRVPANDVESVAQDAYLRAFRALASFQGERPFEHWLLRITVRCCYDYWRKRKTEMERIQIPADENYSFSFDQALLDQSGDVYRQSAGLQEIRERMQAALDELEPDERALVEEIYYDELSHRDAANRRDCSPESVRTRIHRIRGKLQRLMTATRPRKSGREKGDDHHE